ncbi:11366_t:CDS:2, partial [Gigaspora margarita]
MNHSSIAAVADRLKNLKIFLQKTTPVIKNSILPSNLTQTIYESLISIPEIDENLEGDIGFFFECCVDFTELLDFQECNFSECSIANHLIKNIQAGDGYCYIYHTKNTHKKSVTAIYKCNCRIDSVKKPRKHLEKEKQRDTAPRLNRYD